MPIAMPCSEMSFAPQTTSAILAITAVAPLGASGGGTASQLPDDAAAPGTAPSTASGMSIIGPYTVFQVCSNEPEPDIHAVPTATAMHNLQNTFQRPRRSPASPDTNALPM